MFKSMKLGTKIGLGFTVLIVIALSLGGLAVWSMSTVKTVASTLANANVLVDVPEDVTALAPGDTVRTWLL